ncbi:PREDICTED: C-C motif chemokine 5-like [Calidris pugnax]|uniref:C-C motif chemokine 5-like n=1 Tax=Calidris pugnax TaxID=198806 RepID=UPI00071CA9EF|nr:PREDICTED: C-C motif chemokine 5-like [Calidris pugnax]
MKVPAVALATLLLVAICSPAEAQLDDSRVAASSQKPGTIPTPCCFSFLRTPIPRRLLASAYTTSSQCSQPAVILVTKKGKTLCANPQAPWVQEHLKYLEMQEY